MKRSNQKGAALILRPDFCPGAFHHCGLADVPVAVGNVVQPELPPDDGSRAMVRKQVFTLQRTIS